MTRLVERVSALARGEARFSADDWVENYLVPAFSYNGVRYRVSAGGAREVAGTLPEYSRALRSSPPAFAAQMFRASVLSQARFVFRSGRTTKTPGRVFGTRALGLLERPWPRGTTGELLARMEWHAGLAGASCVLRQGRRLRVLRPDWVAVLSASELDPDEPTAALDSEVVGYVYQPGGVGSGRGRPELLSPRDVAYWTPIPDPESPHMGQSWVTAAMRDIQGDSTATDHKLQFFRRGATPGLVVKGLPAQTREQFDEYVDMIEERHTGAANAYRTLYLTGAADASVVGASMRELDFKATQGAGETRIALLGRVPAALLGISEGLAGSSLNAGNFGMARRVFSDSWLHPTLQDVAAALAPLVDVPEDAELWTDAADIPLLREDGKDAAEIDQVRAIAVKQLVEAGFEPDAVVSAVAPGWAGRLPHTGRLSVQLQEPGSDPVAGGEA